MVGSRRSVNLKTKTISQTVRMPSPRTMARRSRRFSNLTIGHRAEIHRRVENQADRYIRLQAGRDLFLWPFSSVSAAYHFRSDRSAADIAGPAAGSSRPRMPLDVLLAVLLTSASNGSGRLPRNEHNNDRCAGSSRDRQGGRRLLLAAKRDE